MSPLRKRLMVFAPSGFLWRLTILNTLVIIAATAISGWAIYNTACFLAAGVGNLNLQRQQQFNSTLLSYLWIFMMMAAISGSILHFYLTKRLIKPIRSLMHSTEELRRGYYPQPIKVSRQDEIGQLVMQYNGLIKQLQTNEQYRKKLVSDLSHEIRTPLSNLNGYLHALKDGDVVGNKKLFTALYEESGRLTQMVEQIDQLKEWDYLSAQVIIKKTTIELKDLLEQCTAMFKWSLKQDNIPIDIDAEACEVAVHLEGIQQVISNLLDNAIRYYQGEGPIKVKGSKKSTGYRISVTGPSKPIPETEKDNIFQRFYRLDSSRSRDSGGTGLGLAITKEIVDRHHGKIGIETSKTRNTFWLELPLNGNSPN